MYCPGCHSQYEEADTYCRHCGEDLTISSRSMVTTTQSRLPALQSFRLPGKVAASVGAVALGVGIELLRRGLVARLTPAARVSQSALPVAANIKDLLQPQSGRALKVPKGYIIDETIVYTRRVIKRGN